MTTPEPDLVASAPGHVCIFTSAHPVDDVRVNSKIAASLLGRGFKVSWVGPASSYFTTSTRPDDRISYRLVSPIAGRTSRLLSARRIVESAKDLEGVDWWYSPDPDAASAALHLARKKGGRVMFDIHEIFHGALLDRWLRGHRLAAVREMLRQRIAGTCARADLVIGVSGSVLQPYMEHLGRGVVVRNCAPAWFSRTGRPLPSTNGVMRVMHGKITRGNGTPVVLAALSRMPRTSPAIQVVLQVPGRSADQTFVQQVRESVRNSLTADRVEFLDGVPHEEMPELLGFTEVGMIAYGRGLGVDSLPNRVFEYMAAGLAILAPSYAVEIKRIIDSEHIGISADFEDPDDVARALCWLADHPDERRAMGRRAREAFLLRHNWENEFRKLLAAMKVEY